MITLKQTVSESLFDVQSGRTPKPSDDIHSDKASSVEKVRRDKFIVNLVSKRQ